MSRPQTADVLQFRRPGPFLFNYTPPVANYILQTLLCPPRDSRSSTLSPQSAPHRRHFSCVRTSPADTLSYTRVLSYSSKGKLEIFSGSVMHERRLPLPARVQTNESSLEDSGWYPLSLGSPREKSHSYGYYRLSPRSSVFAEMLSR